jgi:hypothetical protein
MNEQTPLFKESRPDDAPSSTRSLPATAADSSDPGDALAAVKALQYQFNTLLILLLIVSGTLAVYFYVQCRHSGRELRNLRENVVPQIDQYNTNAVPQMQRFLADLNRYAQQRPDIVPLLNRYGLQVKPASAPGAAAPPAASQPAKKP